jgi:hypothetical protein
MVTGFDPKTSVVMGENAPKPNLFVANLAVKQGI